MCALRERRYITSLLGIRSPLAALGSWARLRRMVWTSSSADSLSTLHLIIYILPSLIFRRRKKDRSGEKGGQPPEPRLCSSISPSHSLCPVPLCFLGPAHRGGKARNGSVFILPAGDGGLQQPANRTQHQRYNGVCRERGGEEGGRGEPSRTLRRRSRLIARRASNWSPLSLHRMAPASPRASH